ncbi:MAG TPA: hypothetical protein VHB98_07000 [Chloroflexota bacterium]|nr:hypothetical protein [Chloroflexota bacterium]
MRIVQGIVCAVVFAIAGASGYVLLQSAWQESSGVLSASPGVPAGAATGTPIPASLPRTQRAALVTWVNDLPPSLGTCLDALAPFTSTRSPARWAGRADFATQTCIAAGHAMDTYTVSDWMAALPDVRLLLQDYAPGIQDLAWQSQVPLPKYHSYAQERATIRSALQYLAPVARALVHLDTTYGARYRIPDGLQ